MPFPHSVILEARKRARFRCVACQDLFVEVHHIQPESEGGSQQLDNAAPLCGSCHNKFGKNPTLRRQLREMRDAWWQECESHRPARQSTTATFPTSAHPQQVRWGPVDGLQPGITLDGMNREFIAWEQLRIEIQTRLLNQLGRSLPVGCSVTLGDFHGRQNWLVQVINPDGRVLAHVWLGPDPDSGWRFDGRVRIGLALDDHHAEVWQIFERFSDGSYRRLEARA